MTKLNFKIEGIDELEKLAQTRVVFCLTKTCEYNQINASINRKYQCQFKDVTIVSGACEKYKKIDEGNCDKR